MTLPFLCFVGLLNILAALLRGARVLVTGCHSSAVKTSTTLNCDWLCCSSLGGQEQRRRYNSNVVNRRSQEVLLLHLGTTVFYELPLSPWTSNIFPVTVWPSSSCLNSARAEKFRRCLPQYVRTSMLGCRRCHLRLNAPVQELKDHFTRYRNSPAMHDSTCTHSSVAVWLWHFLHQRRVSAFPDLAVSTSHIQCGVVRFSLSMSGRAC